MTTRVNSASNTSALAPALGESWGHACNVQLMLQWAEGEREARLYKGGAPGAARFQARRAPGAKPHAPHPPQPPHPPHPPHHPFSPVPSLGGRRVTTARIARPRPPRPNVQVTAQGVRGIAAQRTATKRSAAEAGADEDE